MNELETAKKPSKTKKADPTKADPAKAKSKKRGSAVEVPRKEPRKEKRVARKDKRSPSEELAMAGVIKRKDGRMVYVRRRG